MAKPKFVALIDGCTNKNSTIFDCEDLKTDTTVQMSPKSTKAVTYFLQIPMSIKFPNSIS